MTDHNIQRARINGVFLRRTGTAKRTWLSKPSLVSHFIVLGLSLGQEWREEKHPGSVCRSCGLPKSAHGPGTDCPIEQYSPVEPCYLCGGPVTTPRIEGIGGRVFCSLPCLTEYAS